jgi:hypothetical protein
LLSAAVFVLFCFVLVVVVVVFFFMEGVVEWGWVGGEGVVVVVIILGNWIADQIWSRIIQRCEIYVTGATFITD